MYRKIANYRFLVMFVAFFCLMSVFSNFTIINFTFICMKNDMSDSKIDINGTYRSIYDYTSTEKAEIIWAVAIGSLVGTIPYNWCYAKFGAKYVFLSAGILSIVSTCFLPFAAGSENYTLLLLIRFLQGIAYSADFAVIGIICVKWAAHDELAFFISVLTAFSPFATVLTTTATGLLCTSSLGWRSSYYFHSLAGVIFFTLWWMVYTDTPLECGRLAAGELEIIRNAKSEHHFTVKRKIPYLEMLSNQALICTWFNAFMDLSMSILIITYSPIYFHQVLEFPIDQTAYIIGISNFAQLPFKFGAAFISDKVTFLNPKSKMLIFNTISCGLVAILFSCLGFISTPNRWWAMVLLTISNCLMSTNCAGFYQCGRHVAQQFADVVIAAIQFCKCLALFFVPIIVSATVSEEDNRQQWQNAFLVMSSLLLLANFSAYRFFSDRPAGFTKVHQHEPNDIEHSVELQIN